MMLQIPFVGNRNFQSYREIESNRRFEVYIAFARKIGGATGLNRIVKGC